jgi:serine/threonine protein kinase
VLLLCPPCSRYPEPFGKYWLGPIDPTRPHDEPPGGRYGLRKAGVNSETGESICCKISHLGYEGSEAQRVEIALHAGLRHVNVVDLKDIVFEKPAGRPKKQLCVIMELMAGGDLFSVVADQGGLSEDKTRIYFRQILEGMAYCHARKLIHRNIKLEALLLTGGRTTVKIADFGRARNASEDQTDDSVSVDLYSAPERLTGAEYDGFKSDVWSAGVCLYAMTEAKFPFVKLHRIRARRDSLSGLYPGFGPPAAFDGARTEILKEDLVKGSYRQLKPDRSPEYMAFLKRLLCPDVATRYTAAEALMDPWILGDDWTVEAVQAKVAAMDSSSVVVPSGYAQADWVEQVKRVIARKYDSADGPEINSEDEEDAF